MARIRLSLTLVLMLLVVVTGQYMAAMRGQAGPNGYAVYCIGEEAVTVAVDETGAPVKPQHLCPDCALHVLAGLPPVDMDVPAPAGVVTTRAVVAALAVEGRHEAHVYARGPPSFG